MERQYQLTVSELSMCQDSGRKQSIITGSILDFHYSFASTDEEDMALFSQYITAV